MAAQPVDSLLEGLLRRLGHGGSGFGVEPISAGGNNRVFRVRAKSEIFLAKWYFHSERDPRNRLQSEFSFLEHVWRLGIRCVPKPLIADASARLGLYEFVDGRRLVPAEIDESTVLKAAEFFAEINTPPSRAGAADLPLASEACFTIGEHLALVDARLERFRDMEASSPVDRQAAAFLKSLRLRWEAHKTCIARDNRAMETPLADAWRCLSPSDFGFHNALVRPDRSICFLDFEYAGWDDPAKAFGDFFAHPGIPVPLSYKSAFLRVASRPFHAADQLLERARVLEPIFRVKWCCIVLNEFLPEAAERRRFANPGMDQEPAKARQLDKARRLLASIDS